MLTATIKSSYKKLNPQTGRNEKRFVWTLKGSPKELERYLEEQGDNARKDGETILFFSKSYAGTRQAEVERVTLTDGTVIYRINTLEKDLQTEALKSAEVAKLEAYLEVYGQAPAGMTQIQRPAAQPAPAITNATETEDVLPEGQENLGEPL